MTDPFIGEIQLFGFNFAPRGWAFCDGALMAISQNTALFSLLGTQYGGDGKTTFGLPDFGGNIACGTGQAPGLTPRVQGEMFGQETVTLLGSEMPAHSHRLSVYPESDPTKRSDTPVDAAGLGNPGAATFATAPAAPQTFAGTLGIGGGGQPHENRQPYLAVNFCIALQGVFPPRS